MENKIKKGFTAGAFDVLHAGHCMMLKEARSKCDHLTVLLQTDPSIDRPEKNKPIQSLAERRIQLEANRYVDSIIVYETEEDLYDIITSEDFDIRIIGMDHKGKPYTGDDLKIETFFNSRNHKFSSSDLRNRIYEAENQRRHS